jgi:ketosteroid isomerase-like protein
VSYSETNRFKKESTKRRNPLSTEQADVVRAFYEAVVRRDGQEIGDLVSRSFHEDAAMIWPDGLLYGGRVEGSRRLVKLLAGMATSPVPVGPEQLEVVSVIDGGDQIAAQLAFDWRAPGSPDTISSGALELWTFDGGLVTEIRAYYWDTAACRDLVNNNQAASADA